ncbi:Serine/threonine protein kinase [Trema orientale]|uniref:non-specific serine/threonine protein kinase n=1 Tax=Trema orientale TaxID=63057 RepID=A0A2P5AS70_TREOI|nr:Serine/threonine protein kinase [Trema orientale]
MLYNSNGRIIWQSFDHPTDTLLPTQRLLTENQLISTASNSDHSSGIFTLRMQNDGNLIQYAISTTPVTPSNAYYASNTFGSEENVSLVFDSDAYLYLMNSTRVNMRNITDKGMIAGQLNSTLLMTSGPQGLCGLNGFCIQNDQEPACVCLPGFESVDKGNWTAGCERNFIADSCGKNNDSLKYTMEELPNTIWEDDSYFVLSTSDKEGCINACSDDCNCEAAFYKDGNYRKQRFPLRYGRRLLSDSSIALIKLYTSTPTVDENVPRKRNSKIQKDILIISVSLVSFASFMLVISVVVLCKSNSWVYKRINTRRSDDFELLGEEVALRSFTNEELERITNGFREEIGKGSFGTVYKGMILSSQRLVAVKRLEKVLEEGEREFQTETKAIGRTHHKNLVRLLGYCHGGTNRLLVYEYMCNGSLADMLFTPENKPCWEERLGIACGIARGILYLHEECETQIIHCDIKPQNILMDEYRCAKISDFGLAKLLKPDQTRTFTGIRGTRGRNVIWDLPEEESILEEWAYTCFECGELVSLVGSEEIDKRQLERMVKVAFWCIQEEPSMRPSMKKVLLMLEGIVDIPIPPSPEFFS